MSSRAPQLRDARDRDRTSHHDDDDDVQGGGGSSRRNGDDDDGDRNGSSDDDDDDDVGGGGNSSRRARKKKAAAAAAADAARSEIVVERTVIHEALLRRAIHKDLATFYDAAVVPLESEIDLESQERLVLSFCNIYAINNLAGFDKLKHLQLDNNIIDRIQNLSHLTNLRWLDLSFNNIREITGLEALVNLTDLSLTDNEISTISGLDTLVNLNVLSLGNNKITSLSCVLPLRKFPRLRALNLKGNPVTRDDDYTNSICAYLTNLRYLDHRVIEASQFARARDAKLDQLLVLELKEKSDEAAAKESQAREVEQDLLARAGLAGVDTLFKDMVRSDPEHNKIRVLPGFKELMGRYELEFQGVVEEFVADIKVSHKAKEDEVRLAEEVLDKIHADAVRESRGEIDRFRHLQKKAFKAHGESMERGSVDHAILPALRAELSAVVQELLAVEMLLVEQVESVLEEFEKCYMKIISENVLRINAAFRSMLDASNKHLSNVYELTHSLLERSAKGDDTLVAGGADEVDVRALLADKDVLGNAVSTSHENQEGKIAAKEDEVREREESGGKRIVKKMRDAHRARNRKRVAEIYGMKSIEEAAIAQQEAQQDEDDDA